MLSPPTTSQQFLEMVVQSGLLSEESLRPYFHLAAANKPDVQMDLANLLVKDRLLTPFQGRQILAGRFRGYFLGDKYKVLTLIGSGGTGQVVLCEHLVLQRLVAVKLLQHAAAEMTQGGQAAAVERFVREVASRRNSRSCQYRPDTRYGIDGRDPVHGDGICRWIKPPSGGGPVRTITGRTCGRLFNTGGQRTPTRARERLDSPGHQAREPVARENGRREGARSGTGTFSPGYSTQRGRFRLGITTSLLSGPSISCPPSRR